VLGAGREEAPIPTSAAGGRVTAAAAPVGVEEVWAASGAAGAVLAADSAAESGAGAPTVLELSIAAGAVAGPSALTGTADAVDGAEAGEPGGVSAAGWLADELSPAAAGG
jgi:hypothetical protein